MVLPVAAPMAVGSGLSLAQAGSLASGFGSLLGGLSSVFGGKKKGPTMQDQIDGQIQLQRKQFQQTMENADRYGIHRLVALGAMPSGGASFSIGGGDGGNWATDVADMGQGIGRALDAFSGPEQRKAEDILTRQSVERADLENELLRSEIALKRSQIGPAVPFGAVNFSPDEVTMGAKGFEAGIPQANQRLMYNADGDTIRAMSPELSAAGLDDGPASWYYQLTRTLPDMFSNDVKSVIRKDQAWTRKQYAKFKKKALNKSSYNPYKM